MSGRAIGIATISRDRRRWLRHEALLRESERRTAAALDSVPDPLLGLDGDLRLTYLNEGAAQLVGRLHGERRDRETLIGAHALNALPAVLGAPLERAIATARAELRSVDAGRHRDELGDWWHVHVHPLDGGVSVLLRDVSGWRAAEHDSARRSEQQALVAQLGARSARADDLRPFLDDAVRRIGRAVGATVALVAELTSAGDRLVVRAAAGWNQEGATVVGTADAGDLFGRALADGAAVVADDVLADGRFDVAPALRAHRPAAGAVVPVAGRDETYGALAVFSHASRRFAPPDVDFLQAAAHVLSATIERSRTARRLDQARDAERGRIARALHDEALQDLRYALTRAEEPPGGSEPDERLVEALARIGRELRSVVYDLHLADDERSLDDRLTELVQLHRRMAPELRIELHLAELPERPRRRTTGELVRILGEALTNVRRHAVAGRVKVRVWTSAGDLWCDVADDGVGVGATSGRGIAGMRERAAQVGGQVDIRAHDAGGTVVRVRLPLSPSREAGEPIRVLLVEDHAAVREAIATAFRREPDFDVVGEAGTLADARGMLEAVDVALVDLGLPDGDGSDLIAELRETEPNAQAIVLSAGLDRSVVARAVERGAAGALSKANRLSDVVEAVRRVRAGETLLPVDEVVDLLRFASRERERELLDRQAIESLTSRELEILQLIADGCDSRHAASRLHISVRTQRNHVANILGKLGVFARI